MKSRGKLGENVHSFKRVRKGWGRARKINGKDVNSLIET